METKSVDVAKIQHALRDFADERDWNQFHSPKNLTMALAGEVGELLEHFQWLTEEESRDVMADAKRASGVRDELADVLNYALRIADVLNIDLHDALWDKIRRNAERYPVHLARGNATKYSEFDPG